MKDKKYIKDMNYVYSGGANYIFHLFEAIEDLYLLESDGYMAVRGMSGHWIDETLENIFQEICIDNNNYDFEGSISEWKNNKLYIILLNKKNISILKAYSFSHKDYYFCAEWISYFKEDEVLVDIGHAYDGMREQIHFNDKLSRNKVKKFEKRRGFYVEWTDDL